MGRKEKQMERKEGGEGKTGGAHTRPHCQGTGKPQGGDRQAQPGHRQDTARPEPSQSQATGRTEAEHSENAGRAAAEGSRKAAGGADRAQAEHSQDTPGTLP